ncbi:MAG: hypothetical protein RLZ10_1360 [Bacteroidota bacterium]|jgi:hypothetical protein
MKKLSISCLSILLATSFGALAQDIQPTAEKKVSPVEMTAAEMEKVVAGASTVYRDKGWGYYGYEGSVDWKRYVTDYDNINYKPGNTNGF